MRCSCRPRQFPAAAAPATAHRLLLTCPAAFSPSLGQALKLHGLLHPSTAVLELGCGTGLLAEKMADSLGSYFGVDTSPGESSLASSVLA